MNDYGRMNKILEIEEFTLVQVEEALEAIRTMADDDDETAHGWEDQLHQAVLRSLAKENPMAEMALRSTGIKFARWCA